MEATAKNQQELDKIRRDLMFLCDAEKDSDSCHKLGHFYEMVEKNYEKARQYYEDNCVQRSNKESCLKMGQFMFASIGGYTGRLKEGIETLSKNCLERGSPDSCYQAAVIHYTKQVNGKPHDFHDIDKAIKFFGEGCEKGNANSCEHAGHFYYEGKKVTQNATKAFKYFSIGCDLASIQCCNNAGIMVKNGFKEVKKDEKLLKEFKQKFDLLNEAFQNTASS